MCLLAPSQSLCMLSKGGTAHTLPFWWAENRPSQQIAACIALICVFSLMELQITHAFIDNIRNLLFRRTASWIVFLTFPLDFLLFASMGVWAKALPFLVVLSTTFNLLFATFPCGLLVDDSNERVRASLQPTALQLWCGHLHAVNVPTVGYKYERLQLFCACWS